MTAELSIRFTVADEKAENSPISVSLFRPDTGVSTLPALFAPPLDDAILKDIRWYLEVFSGWPTGPDYERAEGIEAALEDWGRALRDSLIAEPKAARLWQQFVDDPVEGKQVTIDATDPRVLRLPWELLADVGGHIFSAGISVRRRMQQEVTTPVRPFALPVRVLMVVSRPDDAGFIDPRAESKPLLDALAELGDRAEVEFLYPPTLASLTNRLRDRKAPPVHVVHFDGHGVYDASLGLGYLLFEKDDHTDDRVDATRLGTLLNRCGVPLMVLNACQSASQEEANPYASVAARLIRAGVGSVLAMNYSVLVAAARKFVGAFYDGLAAGRTIGQAVDEGRFALLSDEDRHTLSHTTEDGQVIEQTLRLRDWFLPALYQRAEDPVVFRAGEHGSGGAGEKLPRALIDPNAPGGLPAEPLHGFHGRAREMLALERAFAERPIVVLHGFGGMGKTALAAEAGRWFHRTGRFPGGAAFISFEHGGSLSQLCSWAGQAISGDPNFVLGDGDPVQRIAALLAERPSLIILDNFESVLGREPLIPAEELRAVLDAVWTWGEGNKVAAESRVLITTRDTGFNDGRFAPSKLCAHVELGGLAPDDTLALAAAVLADHGIDRMTVARGDLLTLMNRLGGHPLSLYLVLPQLRHHTAAELSARFEELLPGFAAGAAKERNESLAVSLEFSLRRLGAATRAALPDLAVFQGGCMEGQMLIVTKMDPADWEEAKAELVQSAVLTIDETVNLTTRLPNGTQYASHFVRFHPTLAPYLAKKLLPERLQALESHYWQTYYQLANDLYRLDTQHPHEARAIALRELPNLRRGLDLAIAAGAAEEAVDYANNVARFLDAFGRWREKELLLEQVEKTVGKSDTASRRDIVRARAENLRKQGHLAKAIQVLTDLAAQIPEAERDIVLADLGRCLFNANRLDEAVSAYRKAIRLFEDGNQDHMLGMCHAELASVFVLIGRYEDARTEFALAEDIFRSSKDFEGLAVVLGNEGQLAFQQGNFDEALEKHKQSLHIYQQLGDTREEAVDWRAIGGIHLRLGRLDQAEYSLREALRLSEQIQDWARVAIVSDGLGTLCRHADQLAEAEKWYVRAQKFNDRVGSHDVVTLMNLAILYFDQGRLDEAGRYARRVVEIVETQGIQTEVWKTYAILAQVAEAQGRTDEAAGWRRKERKSRDDYAGTKYQLAPILERFQQVIAAVVAGCEGNEHARTQVEAQFDTFRRGNWQIVDAIEQIWAGERDEEALTAKIDYNSRAIVRAILARLAGEPSPHPSPVATGEGEGEGAEPEDEQQGMTLDDLFGLVATACSPGAPAGLGEQLFGLTRELAGDGRLPADVRSLDRVLNEVLAGKRDPDLAALPQELADKVRAMLAGL